MFSSQAQSQPHSCSEEKKPLGRGHQDWLHQPGAILLPLLLHGSGCWTHPGDKSQLRAWQGSRRDPNISSPEEKPRGNVICSKKEWDDVIWWDWKGHQLTFPRSHHLGCFNLPEIPSFGMFSHSRDPILWDVFTFPRSHPLGCFPAGQSPRCCLPLNKSLFLSHVVSVPPYKGQVKKSTFYSFSESVIPDKTRNSGLLCSHYKISARSDPQGTEVKWKLYFSLPTWKKDRKSVSVPQISQE